MSIKEKLKKNGITLAVFAEVLGISRPTLDTYIKLYENNQVIPQEKIQRIFNDLFDYEDSDFKAKLERYHRLIERDKVLGTTNLDAKKTDLISSVMRNIKHDVEMDDYNEQIYIFINMLIKQYRKKIVFQDIINYFLVLYNKKNIEEITDEEKIYISNYFKLFTQQKEGLLEYDNLAYEAFLKSRNDYEKKASIIKQKINKYILKELQTRMEQQEKLGENIEEKDIKQLIDNLRIDIEL